MLGRWARALPPPSSSPGDNGVIAPGELADWLEFRRRVGASRFELWQIAPAQGRCLAQVTAHPVEVTEPWTARAVTEKGRCVFAFRDGDDAPFACTLVRASIRMFADTQKDPRSAATGKPSR